MLPRHHVLGALCVILPLLLAGCGDSSRTTTSVEFMVDVESPIHDIRVEAGEAWANSDEHCVAVLMTQDQTGWSYHWRVGGGQITSPINASAITWRTPLDTLSWIEVTLRRGEESHVCRRWTALRLEPLTVNLQTTQVDPGHTGLTCSVGSSPRAPLTFQWGAEEGNLSVQAGERSAVWDARARGAHRVWLRVDDGRRQAVDTLDVTLPNAAPEFGPGTGGWEEWPCGTVAVIYFRGADANRDPLTLELLSLDGLAVEDTTLHVDPSIDYAQYFWGLSLRDIGVGAGPRSLRLRLSDGQAAIEQTYSFWISCP